jgi:hypothetical protein
MKPCFPLLILFALCTVMVGCGMQLQPQHVSTSENVPTIYAYGTLDVHIRPVSTLPLSEQRVCMDLEANQPPLDPWKVFIDGTPQVWYLFYDDTAHRLPLTTAANHGACLHHLDTYYTLLHVSQHPITVQADLTSLKPPIW